MVRFKTSLAVRDADILLAAGKTFVKAHFRLISNLAYSARPRLAEKVSARADIKLGLVYVVNPRLAQYSMGLSEPRDISILFSLGHLRITCCVD